MWLMSGTVQTLIAIAVVPAALAAVWHEVRAAVIGLRAPSPGVALRHVDVRVLATSAAITRASTPDQSPLGVTEPLRIAA